MNQQDKYMILDKITKDTELLLWFTQWIDSHKTVCCHCGKPKVEKSFYNVKKNTVYPQGRLPICKRCINNLYHHYEGKFGNSYKALDKICQLFDLPYDARLFHSVVDDDCVVGRYLQKLNLRQNKFKTSYEDSYRKQGGRKWI